MTSASLMHEAGHSKQMHWDNPEGWDAEGSSRWGDTCTPMADSRHCMAKTTLQYYKVINFQLKKKKKKTTPCQQRTFYLTKVLLPKLMRKKDLRPKKKKKKLPLVVS